MPSEKICQLINISSKWHKNHIGISLRMQIVPMRDFVVTNDQKSLGKWWRTLEGFQEEVYYRTEGKNWDKEEGKRH